MARIFENDTMYYCRACGNARQKALYQRVKKLKPLDVRICPHCGVLFVLAVANVVTDFYDEPEEPKEEKDPKEKADKKK
jgi:hypothetical protein